MTDGEIHMDVNEVLRPGVGPRCEFVSHEGDRIGGVTQHPGDFELVVRPSAPHVSRSGSPT